MKPSFAFILLLGCIHRPAVVDQTCTFETALDPSVPGSPGHLVASTQNPNGASELALLMRRMLADMEEARASVVNERPSRALFATHQKIRCAWPTEPEDRTEGYDARAQTYLEHVRRFDAARGTRKAAYANVVAGCIACHEASCPGPIERIEELFINQ